MRWEERAVEVTVVGSAGRSHPGIRFHRARSLDPRDTTRIHPIPCTTPARAILEAGFAHPVVNARLGSTTMPYKPDLRWPAQRLSLEIDSSPWHDGPLASELDADRPAELEAAGERVLRTTREQAIRAPQQLIDRLAVAGAPRARRPARTRVLH